MPILSRKAVTAIIASEITFIIAALGAGYIIGLNKYNQFTQKVETLEDRLLELKQRLINLNSSTQNIATKQEKFKDDLISLSSSLNSRLLKLEQGLSNLSSPLQTLASKQEELRSYLSLLNNSLNPKFSELERRFDKMTFSLEKNHEKLKNVELRLISLEMRIDTFNKEIPKNFSLLANIIEDTKVTLLREIRLLLNELENTNSRVENIINELNALEQVSRNLTVLNSKVSDMEDSFKSLIAELEYIRGTLITKLEEVMAKLEEISARP